MPFFRLLYYSFPLRLLMLHVRSHLILILVWIFIALLVTGMAGRFFGMHYLMLTPEYLGEVNFWSFFITGAAFGSFFMIWHLSTYLLCAYRFPFLATLDAPFTKFSLNNSILPLAFSLAYLSATIWFQWHDEFISSSEIAWNVFGFISGAAVLIGLLALYLYFTNKDIASFLNPGKLIPRPGSSVFAPGYHIPTLWEIKVGATRWRVDTYLNERCKLRLVRSVAHYNPSMLEQVFRQNHFNAVLVHGAALFLLIVLGFFMDSPWMRIPTAATVFILGSMIMSLFGAITFWFRNWSTVVFIAMAVLVNLFSGWGFLNYRNRAYGIDYSIENRSAYSYANFEKIASAEQITADKAATQLILENWLARNRQAGVERPKIIFLCVSGGGLRAALWTMQNIRKIDSLSNGKLMRQTALISGASGGMLGAGFMRDVYLRGQSDPTVSMYDSSYIDQMGKDLLNPVCFAVVANDLFYPLSSFESGNFSYRKDRGYLFERQMNENCSGFLARRMADYRKPEQEARIPMMVLSPFVLNDARRLLISPQGMTYLMKPPNEYLHPEIDGIDFGRLFANQEADSLAFTSALRMNCTYPLILPNVWLPTIPSVEVMDAGFRDNYGLTIASRFVHNFHDWISENTGGVVIVQLRCWEKIDPIEGYDNKGILESIYSPATAAASLTAMQDFEQDNDIALLSDILGRDKLQIIRFLYRPVRKQREASLSLHLSKREKIDVLDAFYQPENQAALKALLGVMKN